MVNNLTIGQILGIHKLYSVVPQKFQFKSKNDNSWKDCKNKLDMDKYSKFGYKTREFFN
jgi:hypothetical protein